MSFVLASLRMIVRTSLKNILFFSGTSTSTLQEMFPAPTYEMPNDLFFEVSGILQGFIVIPMGIQFAKLVGSFQKAGENMS